MKDKNQNPETVAVATQSPFDLAKEKTLFQFIKRMPIGAHEYRFDAGKGLFMRNMNKVKDDSLKMHVFYISPVLYADSFYLFNENQEKRTQWCEIGFFNEAGEFGTIMLYDNGIKSLFNCIKEMPENVVCSKDENEGIYLFATIEFSMTDKNKTVVDSNGKESQATYYVPVFKHLQDAYPAPLMSDLELLYNGENAMQVFALISSYRLPKVARFDRETKQRIA
jgi:hypothetical protein